MQPGAERWSLLDALRGLAALTVVFWHWGHFWFEGAPVDGFSRTMFPLYALLAPLYDYGWIAVDMFFVLSGFIFFWKYEAAIGRRSIGPWRFALLRIARLYPLQLLTLILVAGLQAVYRAQFGHAFVYANNDGYLSNAEVTISPATAVSYLGPRFAPVQLAFVVPIRFESRESDQIASRQISQAG